MRNQLIDLEKVDNIEIEKLSNQIAIIELEKKKSDDQVSELQSKLQKLLEQIGEQKLLHKSKCDEYELKLKDNLKLINTFKSVVETTELQKADKNAEIENLKQSVLFIHIFLLIEV